MYVDTPSLAGISGTLAGGERTPEADIDLSTLNHARQAAHHDRPTARNTFSVDRRRLEPDHCDACGPRHLSSRLALDEMAASMGFVVGKLGGAPDGSRVRIELTGPLRRTINVAIEDKGRVVDEFDEPPTATIELDGLLFTRLAGGRTTPAHHPNAATYGGDQAVGQRIVEHLNYVI